MHLSFESLNIRKGNADLLHDTGLEILNLFNLYLIMFTNSDVYIFFTLFNEE